MWSPLALLRVKHKVPCTYSLTMTLTILLSPVQQHKLMHWSASMSIKCAVGRNSQDNICRSIYRDNTAMQRSVGDIVTMQWQSGIHLAVMPWSKPSRFTLQPQLLELLLNPAELPCFLFCPKVVTTGASEGLCFSSRIWSAAVWKGSYLIKGWAVLQACLEFKIRVSASTHYLLCSVHPI